MPPGRDVDRARLAEREAQLDPDDPINIQYTSGTTGNPKGATLTHHNILNNARSVAEVLGYTEADRVCIPVPLYHCFGMGLGTLGCVASGATMVYPAESFAADPTLDAIAEERCTSIYGVPTMFIAMLESPRFGDLDLSSLRTGIMAGAPCPIEVMKRVVDEMHAEEMTIAYGMTETAPVSTMTRRDRRSGPSDIDRRHGLAPRRGEDRGSGDRRDGPDGDAGRALQPGLSRHGGLLGGRRRDQRRGRRRRLDAHRATSPSWMRTAT